MLLSLVSAWRASRPTMVGPVEFEYRSVTRSEPSVHTHSDAPPSYVSSSCAPLPSVAT